MLLANRKEDKQYFCTMGRMRVTKIQDAQFEQASRLFHRKYRSKYEIGNVPSYIPRRWKRVIMQLDASKQPNWLKLLLDHNNPETGYKK